MAVIVVFLFAALVIAAVPLFVWGARGLRIELPSRQRNVVRANLGAAPAGDGRVPTMRQVILEQDATTRIVRPMSEWAIRTARRVTPARMMEQLERRRALAGAESWTTDRILASKVFLSLVAAALAALLLMANPSGAMLVAAAILVAGAFYAPELLLGARGRKRQAEIERAFPSVLDQLTICVEAGLSLDAALARSAETGSGPVAEELSHVLQDVQLGASRQQALEALVARTDVLDIRHFVVAIGQANRYGVAVADALRAQALDARQRRAARAEERAQKMSVKLLFPLIFCILPALLVVVLGPAAIRISHLKF
jgi:tight adherence protein C